MDASQDKNKLLILDANVVVSSVQRYGLLGYFKKNIERVRIIKRAKSETRRTLKRMPVDVRKSRRMAVFGKCFVDPVSDRRVLEGLAAAHQRAADNPRSEEAGRWMQSKQSYIRGKLRMVYPPRNDEERRRMLKKLNKNTKNDRMIAAKAATLAAANAGGGGAFLVSNDGDLVEFAGVVSEITDGRLCVIRPGGLQEMVRQAR